MGWNRNEESSNGRVKDVISYEDDVYVWVYLDQIDRVIRYEAFVIGYDDRGEPTTLEFVIEEGVLDNMHEVPLFCRMLQEQQVRHGYQAIHQGAQTFTADGRLVASTPLKYFYADLTPEELEEVHAYFAARERELKVERCSRWTRMLRALGYDVLPSLL